MLRLLNGNMVAMGRWETVPLGDEGGASMISTETNQTITTHDKSDPGIDNNSRVKVYGYIRRIDAANYLGISLRTLTNWQQRRIIPFVQVGHRVTLFRIADLDRAMNRFTIKAVGDETE